MQKLISGLSAVMVLIGLTACQPKASAPPDWRQTLDLCQLGQWRAEAYPELNAACAGAVEADAVLTKRLALRQLCLELNDFSSCATRPEAPSDEASLDKARRLSLTPPDEFAAVFEAFDEDKSGMSEREIKREIERLKGWKKELDDAGILKGDYAGQIRGSRWNASAGDWLAYHAYTAEASGDPKSQLTSNITLATSLADQGLFEDASAVLQRVDKDGMGRVLEPDWKLYGSEDIDFSAEDKPYPQRHALSRYRNTVSAIFAIQFHSGNTIAARKTLKQAKGTLNLMGVTGQEYIDVMAFLLGQEVPKEELFRKVFLGPEGGLPGHDRRMRDGLAGWESLADGTALAPLLKERLDSLQTGLSGYELETTRNWRADPNMSDLDFLRQPPGLRAKMAYYKNQLKFSGDTDDKRGRPEAPSFTSPKHVSFSVQESQAGRVDDALLMRIKEAGIGTYGVIAAREQPEGGVQIIYRSSAIDPSGETGIQGYWLLEGNPETREWVEPFYLGLRTLMPYVIDGFAPDMPKAAQRGDEVLRLTGARQPLDLSTITFPPISMTRQAPERGVLTVDMGAVKRDRDGDSLTDLFEERIGLNPDNPDTDGDRLRDNRDSVPTQAYGGTFKDRSKAYALLSIMEGHEDGAIIEMPAEPDEVGSGLDFALQLNTTPKADDAEYRDPIPRVTYFKSEFEGLGGVDLPYMLIVQSPEEAQAMSEAFAPHYPVGIKRRLDDPFSDQMIIIWSAQWVGGTTLLTRQPGGGYKREVLSFWIT